MRHIAYLKYLLKHKYYVLKACRMTGAPIWRGLVHDLSKLLPSEWVSYARTFYDVDGSKRYAPDVAFDMSWLKHQHRNAHHWQHWVLREDSGRVVLLEMPEDVAREMVADWIGAGWAITGDPSNVHDWYRKNYIDIQLNPATRAFVNSLLESLL